MTPARDRLEAYVHRFDPRVDAIPKGIDPPLVAEFVRGELGKGRPAPGPAARLAELVDFFRLDAAAPWIAERLDGSERSGDEVVISAALARALALVGGDADRDRARQTYRHLLAHAAAERRIPALFSLLLELAPEEPFAPTRERLDALFARRAGSKTKRLLFDPSSEQRQLEDWRNVTLPRLEAAVALRSEILATPEPPARIGAFVAIYLSIDMRYSEQLARWAPRRLQLEAASGRTAEVVEAFRWAIGALDPAHPATDARRARSVHAIEFFGGALTAEESEAVRPEQRRWDLLSLD